MTSKIALLSLSNDLKRICTSIQRESLYSAKEFNKEAKKWLVESKKTNNSKVSKLLKNVEKVLARKNDLTKAEDCLMYSVLLQNKAISLS